MNRRSALLALSCLLAACGRQAPPGVDLEQAPGRPARFTASGASPQALAALEGLAAADPAWASVFSVSVGPGLPPMAGRYALDGHAIRFTPDFPLEAGRAYVARFAPGPGRPEVVARLAAPVPAQPAPAVADIYPSGPVVPQNLLRLYVQFSAPMAVGRLGSLALIGPGAKAVAEPFLPLGYAFWSPDRTRLTVLVDPGRVKRGVLPDPVLKAGSDYTVIVGADWQDRDGRSLAAPFRRTYRAALPERRALDLAAWRLTPPRAGAAAPLRLAFDRPLDQALLLSAIGVQTAAGDPVAGRAAPGPQERSWAFTPQRPWTDQPYRVVVQPWLEDPAGNRPGRPFEQPAGARAPAPQPGLIALPFTPAR